MLYEHKTLNMKILIVSIGLPYPLSHGANLRLYNLMNKLSEIHELYLLSLEDGTSSRSDDVHVSALVKDVIYEKVPDKTASFLKRLLISAKFKSKVQKKIKHLVERNKINVIHYHYPASAEYGLIKNKYGVPQVLDNVDSRTLLYKRNMAVMPINGFFTVIRHFVNSIRVPFSERALVNKADVTVVVSPVDARYINKLSKEAIVKVIPNGVDSDYFIPTVHSPPDNSDRKNIVFIGNMDFLPNIHAVLFFVLEVLPLIKRVQPEILFNIVGKNPVDSIMALSKERGIEVLGYVDDVRKYYEHADVVIIPMVSGGGIKNKALEAFALSRPVVSTSLGMEAIDAVRDMHAKLADTPEDIATAVLQLLESKTEAERIGANARKLVEDKYSWIAAADDFDSLYKELTGIK